MTILYAQKSSEITALNRCTGRAIEKRNRTRNQIKVGKAARIRSGMRGKKIRLSLWSERRKRANKSKRRLPEDVEGARKNDWLACCSRRSNFQNGLSSIKQVLLSLLQRASSTNPSQNVRRMLLVNEPAGADNSLPFFLSFTQEIDPRISHDWTRSFPFLVCLPQRHQLTKIQNSIFSD